MVVSGCKEKIKPGNTKQETTGKITAELETARETSHPFIYEAVGTITAGTSTIISCKVFGNIKKIHVHEGSAVKKGDLLAEIDDSQAAARLKKAMAGLSEAKKALAAAKSSKDAAKTMSDFAFTTFKRYQKLLKENSVSPQEFDNIKSKYHRAKAALSGAQAMIEAALSRINQAKADVTAAEIYRKDTLVKAPYSGRIKEKFMDQGNLASPGVPLFSMETSRKFKVEFSIPEGHVDRIYLNQSLTVKIPSMQNLSVRGIVDRIDPAADPATRSFNIRVTLPDAMQFRSGVFARIMIPAGIFKMILVPETALIHHGQLTGFFLVDDKNTAHFRLVRTGRKIKGLVEIISGIHPGDRYIVNPGPGVQDNVLVEAES